MTAESLDGLSDHGVPADDRGGRHADHDGSCEVPGRNDRTDAEWDIDELVAFALERHDRLRLRVAERLARVKLEKVYRFGDVAVGLDPTLSDFVDEEGIVLESAVARKSSAALNM